MDDCGVAEPLTRVRVVVREGRHRMVRRMRLAHCGHPVLNLRRLAYGAVKLGGLRAGQAARHRRRAEVGSVADRQVRWRRAVVVQRVMRCLATRSPCLGCTCRSHARRDALLARIEVRPLARCHQHQVLHPLTL